MNRLLHWLNPNTPLRGAAFGFLFGLIAVEALFLAFAIKDDFRVKRVEFYIIAGVCFAIPWAVLWTISGSVCWLCRNHAGTVATSSAFLVGVGYSFWESSDWLNPWLPLTVPFYTAVAFIPCLLFCFATFGVIHATREAR